MKHFISIILILFIISCKKQDVFITKSLSIGVLPITMNITTPEIPILKNSYELSNSNQWININDGFASFTQFDFNNDSLDDVIRFEGYNTAIPYTWVGPTFVSSNGVTPNLNYNRLFASKEVVGDFNKDNFLDVLLLTAMDPAGCGNCKDETFPLYIMKNQNGKSFTIDSLNYKGIWGAGASGDIDNDGDIDLITFSSHHEYDTNILNRIFINNGNGDFNYKKSNLDSIAWVDRCELIDMNNDGFLDLIMNDAWSQNSYTNRFRILWNDRHGNFNQNNSITIPISNNMFVLQILAFDLDGDNNKEIILPMNDSNGNWKIFVYQKKDGINYKDVTSTFIDNNSFSPPQLYNPLSIMNINNKVNLVVKDKRKNIRWELNNSTLHRIL
jgi:hypothetical protein